jgi:hypothetical protein
MRQLLSYTSFGLLVLAGCEPRPPEKPAPVFNQQCDYMLVAVVDVTGSYLDILEKRGFPLLLATCDQYFSARVGANDRLVIARVSGSERALLWDGPPMALRESFASPAAFRAFLEKNAGGGSRVYDSVADATTYCLDFPGVAHEKTCVMVLSDMEDNFPDSAQSKARMLNALSAYAKKGGSVGFYFVGQAEVTGLRQDLAKCGFKHPPVVESEIVVSPALPTFGE